MRATNTFRWVENRDLRYYQTRLELAKFICIYSSSCDYLESARLEGTWRQSRGSTPRWQLLLRRRMDKEEISASPLPIGDKLYATSSYAALRAADLDWIVGLGYSPGR